MAGGDKRSVAALPLLCCLFLGALFGLASAATQRDDVVCRFTSPATTYSVINLAGTDKYYAHHGMRRLAGFNGMVVVDVSPGQIGPFTCDHHHPLHDWWHKSTEEQTAASLASGHMVWAGGEPQPRPTNSCGWFLANCLPAPPTASCNTACTYTLVTEVVFLYVNPAAAAAADKFHHVATALDSDLLFHRIPQILSSTTNSLVAMSTMTVAMLNDLADKRKRSLRGRGSSPAVAMAILLLLAVGALLNAAAAAAARPLHAGVGDGPDEAAATSPALTMTTLNKAASGHSACTNDPNTLEPFRCVHH